MGEIADMMIEGILDANGEYTGRNPGHPIYPKGWFGETPFNYHKKCLLFLKERKIIDRDQANQIITDYGVKIGSLSVKHNKICKLICSDTRSWGKFKTYVDNKIGYIKPSKQK